MAGGGLGPRRVPGRAAAAQARHGPGAAGPVKVSLGVALLVVCTGLIIRPLLAKRRQAGETALNLVVKRVPTLLIGILGGLVVGLTSVGSGSLIIIMLLMLYPRLRLSELVGTDLVQAVPLVTSAAIGHLLFGNFELSLTASILIGSIPGVFIGARFSSRAPDYVIRPALVVVLLMSGMKLVGAPNMMLVVTAPFAVGVGIELRRLGREPLAQGLGRPGRAGLQAGDRTGGRRPRGGHAGGQDRHHRQLILRRRPASFSRWSGQHRQWCVSVNYAFDFSNVNY